MQRRARRLACIGGKLLLLLWIGEKPPGAPAATVKAEPIYGFFRAGKYFFSIEATTT